MMETVSALPAVPGAIGAYPAPPAVAMISATRSRRPTARAGPSGALGDELVPLGFGNADASEPPGLEAAAQVHDAVDLGRLARRAALPRERRILAAAVDE